MNLQGFYMESDLGPMGCHVTEVKYVQLICISKVTIICHYMLKWQEIVIMKEHPNFNAWRHMNLQGFYMKIDLGFMGCHVMEVKYPTNLRQ